MSDLFQTQTLEADFETDFLNPEQKVRQLSSQIDWVITQRKYDYLDQLIQLRSHKSVAIRRKLATSMGILGSKDILAELQKWQLEEGDRDTWLILDGVIDKINRGLDQIQAVEDKIYSVSEALKIVKTLIGEKEYLIEGELSEVRPVRQMYYFGIKDSEDVRIDCGCFAGIVARLGFPLNEGLTVRVKGKFRIGKNSRLYFDVKNIVLTGEGALLRNLEILKQKLKTEGLLDESRKRKLALVPRRILLLASKTSAAFSDYHKVLGQRIGGIQIYFISIKTQGVGAEYDLIQKLEIANQAIADYDIETVVITRGGGSQDDLALFNSEKVARAVHGIKAPVIVAIGHERDVTLAELVADVRASTPSQAAELSSLSKTELKSQLRANMSWFASYYQSKKSDYLLTSQKLATISMALIVERIKQSRNQTHIAMQTLRSLIHNLKTSSNQTWNQINSLLKQQIFEFKNELGKVSNLLEYPKSRILESYNSIQGLTLESQNLLNQRIAQVKLVMAQTWPEIQLANPQHVLERGYALIKQNGQIKESIKDLKDKSQITIQMRDGEKTI